MLYPFGCSVNINDFAGASALLLCKPMLLYMLLFAFLHAIAAMDSLALSTLTVLLEQVHLYLLLLLYMLLIASLHVTAGHGQLALHQECGLAVLWGQREHQRLAEQDAPLHGLVGLLLLGLSQPRMTFHGHLLARPSTAFPMSFAQPLHCSSTAFPFFSTAFPPPFTVLPSATLSLAPPWLYTSSNVHGCEKMEA